MGNYVRILEEVEAVRATGDNLEEIKKLAGKEAVKRESYPKLPGHYYIIHGVAEALCVGQWLIKHKSGWLEVKSNKMFLKEYEPK